MVYGPILPTILTQLIYLLFDCLVKTESWEPAMTPEFFHIAKNWWDMTTFASKSASQADILTNIL